MFNKKRLFVFIVFMLFMFFMMTFASGTPQNQAIVTRTVTFIDGFNNSEYDVQKIEVGTDATVPKDPYHYGYIFTGWYELENETKKVSNFRNVLNDLSVIAKYDGDTNHNGIADIEEDTFTVTFRDSISNNVLKTQEVLEGMSATAPRAPRHSGYNFTGWSRSYTNVTSNITVNTVYTQLAANINMFDVTFIDGDTNETITKVSVSEGSSATVPETPKHEGRVFDHFEGNYVNVIKNEEVVAVYLDDINNNNIADDNEIKYAVYYHNGVAKKGNVPVDNNRYLTGLKYTVLDNNDLALDKAIFLGWSLDERDLVTNEESAKNIVSAGYVGTINEANVHYYAVFAEDKNNNKIPDYDEKHYTVEFKALENGSLKGTTKYENILVDLTFEEAGIVVPTTIPNEYYKFNTWTPTIVSTVTNNIIYEASFMPINDKNGPINPETGENEGGNNIPDEIEGHFTINFTTTGRGKLEGTTKFENILTGLSFKSAGIVVPTTIADKYYKFNKWIPETPNEKLVVTKNETYTANFIAINDENENEIADEEEEHYTIEFVALKNGSLQGTTKFEKVLTGLTFEEAGITVPTPVANKYYKFDEWTPSVETTVTKSIKYTAKFVAINDENENKIADEEEDHYTIKFVVNGKGTLTGTTEFKNVLKGLTYKKAGVAIPTPEAKEHYKFNGWTPVAPTEDTVATSAHDKDVITYTANFVAINDENENEIADEEEEHYTIEFVALKNGSLQGTTKFEKVLTGLTFEEAGITVPTPVANKYYKFDEWTPSVETTVTKSIKYTAKFVAINDENENEIADEEEEHYTIEFVALKNGSLQGTTKFEKVLTGLTFEEAGITVPTPVANKYYKFDEWTPSVETTVTKSIKYTAKFVAINDENENEIADEEEDHYTIKFVVNGKGTLTGTTEFKNVLKGLTYIKAGVVIPTPEAKEHYKFNGWTPSKPTSNTIAISTNNGDIILYTANFIAINDENENEIADEEEDHYTVKFVVNGKGTLTGTTEFKNVLKGLTYIKAGVVIPTPEAKEHYKFNGWTPSKPTSNTIAISTNNGDIILYTANFIAINDENENEIADEEEDKFTVEFLPGTHGTLSGTAKFENVLTGLSFAKSKISLPVVNVTDSNYEFDKWSPNTPNGNTIVNENKTYTATYKLNTNKKLTLSVSSNNQSATVYETAETVKKRILSTVTVNEEFDATYNVEIENFSSVNLNTAGSNYTLTIKVTDSLGNTDSKNITLNILKRKATVSIDDKSSIYGSSIKSLTYTVSGELDAYPIGISISTTATSTSDVARYPITGEFTNKNYDVNFENGKYSIEQKEVTLEWSNTTFTYDTTSHKPSAEIRSGIINNDVVNVTVSGAQVNVGKHTATASIDNNNYVIKNPNKDFNINPQEVSVNWSNLEFTYDTESHKPSASVTIAGIVISLEVSGAQTNAGTYTASADYKATEANSNYKLINASTKFKINKATPKYTVPTGLKAVEDDTLGSVTLPNGFTYEKNTSIKLPVGEYKTTVKFTPKDTDNYLVVSGIEITISVEDLYDIKFISEGNTVVTRKATINKTVTPPTNPTKDKTAQYTYTFIGWYVEGDENQTIVSTYVVKGDTNYIAKYNRTINYYTVEFQDYYGNRIGDVQSIAYGSAATAPKPKNEVSSGSYLFEFTNWSTEEYKEVKKNLEVKAIYEIVSTVQTNVYVLNDGVSRPKTDTGLGSDKYTKVSGTVTIKLKNNTEVQNKIQEAVSTAQSTGVPQEVIIASEVTSSANVESYLSAATIEILKNNSTVAGEDYYTDWYVLKFRTDDGWHLDGERKYITYEVIWKNYDGTILETDNVRKGVIPTYNGSTPTKPSSDGKTYVFDGWNTKVVGVTKDTVYTATFKELTSTPAVEPTFIVTRANKLLTIVTTADITKLSVTYEFDKVYTEQLEFYKVGSAYYARSNSVKYLKTLTITYDKGKTKTFNASQINQY